MCYAGGQNFPPKECEENGATLSRVMVCHVVLSCVMSCCVALCYVALSPPSPPFPSLLAVKAVYKLRSAVLRRERQRGSRQTPRGGVYPTPSAHFKQTLAELGLRTEPGGGRGCIVYTFHLINRGKKKTGRGWRLRSCRQRMRQACNATFIKVKSASTQINSSRVFFLPAP